MAVTINNLWGAETGGMDEASAFSGASASTVQVHSGTYSYTFTPVTDTASFEPYEVVADARVNCVLGFWFRTPPDTTTSNILCELGDGTNFDFNLRFNAGVGTLVLRDSAASVAITSSALSVSTWYFIEVYVERLDSGGAELFINGISEGTASAKDFNAVTGTPVVKFLGTNNGAQYIDDIYFMSDAADASSRLGGCELFSYRSSIASAVPDTGDNLSSGIWSNAQQIPFNDTNVSRYIDTIAQAGHIITDDIGGSSGGGPSGDTNIDGTIKAIKGMWRARRDNGSATDHFGLLGNDGDGVTRTPVLGLTNTPTLYTMVSELATIVPTDAEFCRIGIEKTSGGRLFNCFDMLAVILHVPAPSVTPPSLIYKHNQAFQHLISR